MEVGRETEIETDRHRDSERDKQTERQRQTETWRQADRRRQTDRDRQTETERDRQTDRQTERQTERERAMKYVQYDRQSRTVTAGEPEHVSSIVNIRPAVIMERNSSRHASEFSCSLLLSTDSDSTVVPGPGTNT